MTDLPVISSDKLIYHHLISFTVYDILGLLELVGCNIFVSINLSPRDLNEVDFSMARK